MSAAEPHGATGFNGAGPVDVRRATEMMMPTAAMLGQTVSIKGDGAEHVGGVEGAVDRIATEILRRLERGGRWSSGRSTPRGACRPNGNA